MASLQSRLPSLPDSTSSLAADPAIVTISRAEYCGLAAISHKYANLCQNLINGGVGEETIELLSSQISSPSAPQTLDEAPVTGNVASKNSTLRGRPAPRAQHTAASFVQGSAPSVAIGFDQYSCHHNGKGSSSQSSEEAPDLLDLAADVTRVADVGDAWQATTQPRFEREATRSVQLLNLAVGTTHQDVTSVVRGGLLLDVYLKYRDNSAVISFLHGVDAQAFYEHVRQNGLYIKSQRVDVRWNKCQFTLAGHTAHKIGLGATRNLVIRHRNPNLTERHIRDDLEHIHNLVVLKVEFIGDSCYIDTNSVHNAVFARLSHESTYKGSRVEWGIDECAQPLDRMALPKRRSMAPTPANNKPMNPMANRFELLQLDD